MGDTSSKQQNNLLPIWGVPDGYDAFLLKRHASECFIKDKKTLVHVARNDADMIRIADLLNFIDPSLEVLNFPGWDCLPYDRVSPNKRVVSERVATLTRLLEPVTSPRIVLTTISALLQKVAPRSVFSGRALNMKKGDSLDHEFLIELLVSQGYNRTDTVMEAGEFAVRGNLFDIFLAGEEEPVRLDLFGDEVDSIRSFDPISQRSTGTMDALIMRPTADFSLDEESIARFRTKWRDLFGSTATNDPIYDAVSNGRRYQGIEHWLPLFHEKMETLFDYIPRLSLSFAYQAEEALQPRLEMIADHYEARKQPVRPNEVPYRPLPSYYHYLNQEAWDQLISAYKIISFHPFAKPDGAVGVDAGGRPGIVFAKSLAVSERENVFAFFGKKVSEWGSAGRKVIIAAWSKGSRERIATLLKEHQIPTQQLARWIEVEKSKAGIVNLLTLGVDNGFIADDFALISEQDLLGERISRPHRQRKRAEQFISEASEISEGDLVVHQEYGIGQYQGLINLDIGNAPHDCLSLMYHGEEKLFLPIENIELLSRFGSDQSGVALDRLGSPAWQKRKATMKARIRDMADALLRTAATRLMREASIETPPEGLWEEFCAGFPFIETEDQSRAVADIIQDLSSGRPMDRLICGDVGFGKTEVALRAAFIAAMGGSQVAVVVPTTLLARQHYRTFMKRFDGFPIKVAQLSRMVTAKDATQVKKEIADGTVNIVIGTHALLAKGIQFANLGMLIIDEEQHFGVAHKEKLKALREDIHVLTLSATPLPRTLQLSLTGMREISLIATPPVDRLAVRTFIMPFDRVVIREALQRERFRGGQAFCVVPRLQDLQPLQEQLLDIIPDLRLVQAHGRLTPTELERVMTEFSDGKYDVLLSTNIVESGLDMPSVNTLIIYKADRFGLGQLYQLRGRVGRGKQRGYAYLTWPQNHFLSKNSEKRLEIMQSLDNLGAGFTLASHDLDLRGAGNLLGEEQSGHIREVGVELYQKMLEETVASLRAERDNQPIENQEWSPNIVLGLAVLIPENYVTDLPVRLGLYRRIGNLVQEDEIEAMRAELIDRFGDLPDEVSNLLAVVKLKGLCKKIGVQRVDAGPKGVVVQFLNNQFKNPEGLIKWVAGIGEGYMKLRPDGKLVYLRETPFAKRVQRSQFLLEKLREIYNFK
ncbi:transcription-repair coupling factor [Commensalibacter communis]|uniref:transcription-repair coupling factor n=1 Tax=Commensalibacter communis TaxID=2972786 RepID=UPI0022FFBC05|nr:transcription-repair coupling factor [Commensalibacter communis]CAI3926089.1 Transcription-repair coupling factor (superfamily II helicase) (Mfd) (PDB:2EYQ) [Commensalibacter communis]CAI3928602.1 Transcription-repair coupling factor (superfamily II helicase) (Mfd) (PDB:2EYQ) [Commensalibacter communis]